MTVGEVLAEVEKDKGFYDNTGGGLTVSGGEVLAHAEFAGALIDAAAARGFKLRGHVGLWLVAGFARPCLSSWRDRCSVRHQGRR